MKGFNKIQKITVKKIYNMIDKKKTIYTDNFLNILI
jgi:hypothetical protein